MTKRLECPLDGCHTAIEDETEANILARVEDHAAEAHPELELDAETVDSLKSGIEEV